MFWIATFYPALKPNMSMYDDMLSNPTFQALLGEQVATMGTFVGFMTMEVFSYMGLVLGAYIIFMAASFAAGEIEQKSSELLLSLPVRRESLIISRFTAMLPFIALIVLAELAAIYAGGRYIGEDSSIRWFAYAMLFMGFFLVAVGAMALLISSLMSDGRKAALVSLGILLGMFLVENIGSMVTSIDWARSLSLFHYVRLTSIVMNHEVVWRNAGILLVITVVCLVLAVIVFRQRDINVT
ncbi:putative ABC transporter [Methanocella paludicola SANAE]|uniref:ABC transporter n=1 Tax=Methanocella paludicola (strain DSM 17711 / JCM 13418 / NBRC 101707 / SANAE) TaxID=304371 RepID=D1YXZ1_METPS|nr:putative ABC transporter [Methanocella paludicola SANAE]